MVAMRPASETTSAWAQGVTKSSMNNEKLAAVISQAGFGI
ncbi:hypothetical protein CSC33_1471 [Pseudomonas aeruginosa]|nr:hypothetical protein CSC33_1471 [Pseudomonas aeruginosa]